MHTLQVKISNQCGLDYAKGLIAQRIDLCAQAARQAAAVCESVPCADRKPIIGAFVNGCQNIRML